MIVIPAKADKSNPLNSKASKLFGKAPAFVLVSEKGEGKILKNDFANGKKLAKALIDMGIKTLITDHLGQEPYKILAASSIDIRTGDLSGTVASMLEVLAKGELAKFEPDMPKDKKHARCEPEKRAENCTKNCDSHAKATSKATAKTTAKTTAKAPAKTAAKTAAKTTAKTTGSTTDTAEKSAGNCRKKR